MRVLIFLQGPSTHVTVVADACYVKFAEYRMLIFIRYCVIRRFLIDDLETSRNYFRNTTRNVEVFSPMKNALTT